MSDEQDTQMFLSFIEAQKRLAEIQASPTYIEAQKRWMEEEEKRQVAKRTRWPMADEIVEARLSALFKTRITQ